MSKGSDTSSSNTSDTGGNISEAKQEVWAFARGSSHRQRSGNLLQGSRTGVNQQDVVRTRSEVRTSTPPRPNLPPNQPPTKDVPVDPNLRPKLRRNVRLDPNAVRDIQQKIVEVDAYKVELEEARSVLLMLSASRFVNTSLVQSTINAATKKVAEGETMENYKSARQILKAVKDQADHAASMAEVAVRLESEVGQALADAENKTADLEKYPFVDSKAVREKVDRARDLYDAAKNATDLNQAKNALNGFDGLAAEAREAGKKGFEQLDKYKTDHRTATDRLAEAGRLRGAQTDPRVQFEVKRLRDAIASSDLRVAAATDADQVKAIREHLLHNTKEALEAAKKQSTAARKDFDEALKSMPEYLAAYRDALDARDTIAAMPGSADPLRKMDALLLLTRTAPNGTPPAVGFTEALKALRTDTPKFLEAARGASKAYLEKDVDKDLAREYKAASDKLDQQDKVLPAYLIKMHRAELADAVAAGKDDLKGARAQVQAVNLAIDKEVKASAEAKESAAALVEKVKTQVGYLKSLKAPAVNYAAEEKTLARVEKDFLPALDFEEAAKQLTGCLDAVNGRVDYFLANGREWKKAAEYLDQSRQTANKMMKWPAARREAADFLTEMREARAEIETTLDYDAGLKWFKDFKSRFATFESATNLPGDDDLEAFDRARNEADEKVRQASHAPQEALKRLEEKLDGVRSKDATSAHAKYEATMAAWQKYWLNPVQGREATMAEAVEKRAEEAVLNLEAAQQMAETILADEKLLGQEKASALEADARADDASRPARVLAMIDGLETIGGGVTGHRSKLKQYNAGGFDDEKARARFLVDLEKAVQQDIDSSRKAFEQLKADAQKVIQDFEGVKKKLQKKDKDFLAYFQGLGDRLDDARGLLASDDFEIVVNACKQIKAVGAELDRVRPDGQKDSSFKAVDEKIAGLSDKIGNNEKIRHYLKDSYFLLKAELDDATAASRKVSAEEGLKLLAEVEKKIDALAVEADQAETQYKAFKARYEAIEKKGMKIAKVTQTRVTDRCEAYYARFLTTLSEAKGAAKKQGTMDDALALLNALESDLDSILSSPDSRAKLQEFDAQAEQEQRLIRDLSKRWETRLKQFLDTELPRTRQEMIRRVKEGKATVADLGQVDDLEGTAGRADKLVEPYTANISALPHKKHGANPSPPMDKALGAFGQANTMLDNAARAARRLAGDPEGTNVNISGDLKKIEANWVARARNFAAAIDGVIREVNATASKEGSVQEKEAAKAAVDALGPFTGRFKDGGFAATFQVLTDPNAQENDKLKAREQALRVVREYREALRNPLLIASTAGKDPYSRRLRPAFAMLETALKKIELEALVAD